ncbi:MAG: TonB family protein, partial [Bacteroidota bacterium]
NEISASETPVASEVAKPQVEVEKNEIIARENTVEEKDSPKEEAKSEALDQKKPPKVDKAPIAPEKVSLEQKEDSKASEYVYLEAEPLNGIASLYEYFDETLTYPVEALKDSIQGVTLVTFTINTAGRAEKIIIEKSLGPLFDKEAIRVLDGMQEWRPASINGQSIDSKVSIPLTFRIEK